MCNVRKKGIINIGDFNIHRGELRVQKKGFVEYLHINNNQGLKFEIKKKLFKEDENLLVVENNRN